MKKIMFSDKFGLTEAVLSGRKTQTRRIIPQSSLDKANEFQQRFFDATFDVLSGGELLNQFFIVEKIRRLPYKVGEIVAIAQSYKDAGVNSIPCEDDEFGCYDFPAEQTNGWDNKMFVRADLMPRQIRFTRHWVERLQDISEEDCIKEGVYMDVDPMNPQAFIYTYTRAKQWFYSAREAYAALIDKVSGKGMWESNPYVFVYEFELLK